MLIISHYYIVVSGWMPVSTNWCRQNRSIHNTAGFPSKCGFCLCQMPESEFRGHAMWNEPNNWYGSALCYRISTGSRRKQKSTHAHSGRMKTKIGYRVLWFISIANKTATPTPPTTAAAVSSRTTIPKQTWKFGYGNVYCVNNWPYTMYIIYTEFALKSHLQQIPMRLKHNAYIRTYVHTYILV